jgi:hypothetical protein
MILAFSFVNRGHWTIWRNPSKSRKYIANNKAGSDKVLSSTPHNRYESKSQMLVVKRSGLCLHHIQLYWLSNLFCLEGYSRNASCALNLISTFSLPQLDGIIKSFAFLPQCNCIVAFSFVNRGHWTIWRNPSKSRKYIANNKDGSDKVLSSWMALKTFVFISKKNIIRL